MLSSLLYACEPCSLYERHVQEINQFYHKCLRKQLKITCATKSLTLIFSSSHAMHSALESPVQVGLLSQNNGTHSYPKRLSLGELVKEKLSHCAQKKRYEDCLNQSLGIWFCCETWETLALDLPTWRRKINEVAVLFEKKSRSLEETSAMQAKSHLLAICPRNSPVSRIRQSSPHPYWIVQPQLHTAPVLSPRAIVDRN